MKLRILFCCALMCPLAFAANQGKKGPAPATSASDIPHLRKQGAVTQLIVDGKPFLALAGELDNDAATGLEGLRPIWPELVKMNLNTVLPVAYWELVEPEEGKFDFALVDGLIQEARRHNLRLGLVWFASWKNGLSSYAPLWAKKDFKRFPRVQTKTGAGLEVFSPIEGYGDATRDADARAFAALMRHIKEVDGQQHTVIMMQVENEVGVLGGIPRPLAGGGQSLCGAGAERADGLPSEAQGHPDAGVPPGVGGGRLQDIRDLGRGVRQGRRDG